MALPSLSATSFVGSLLVNWQTVRFDQYITEQYPQIVQDCIGVAAFQSVNSTTQTKWADLFSSGAYIRESDGVPVWSNGLMVAVRLFLWSSFVSDNFVPTNNGMIVSANENSNQLALQSNARVVQKRYNGGVIAMQELADFVANFTDFAQGIDAIVDNGGGSFTIETTETKYLADGDTVSINGAEYIVSNLVAGVSFDIESDTTPAADTYISNPYSLVVLGNLRAMV